MNKSVFLGFVSAVSATVIWAGNFIVARLFAESLPPCQFNFWRWVLAFLVILPFATRHIRNDLTIASENFGYLSVMAVVGVSLMNVFVYKAAQTTESLNMALITPASPAIILILARIFYKEKISVFQSFGLLICISGVLLLISKGQFSKFITLNFNPGDIWIFGCVLSFAVYSLLIRKRPQRMTVTGFNTIIFGLGVIYSLPVVIIEFYCLPAPVFTWRLFLGICYAGIGCSTVAFWFWTVGIDKIGPIKAGFIYYSLPVFAAIMATFVLGEKIIAAQIIGGVLIIGGIIIATLKRRNS